MYPESACGLTVAIPLLMTLHLNIFTKRAFAGNTHKCSTNYYHDGYVCKECPAGYYGVNCSRICPALYYGIMCLQKCDCSTCHHVHGCVFTPRLTGTTSHECVTKDETKDTTKTQETTNSKNENKEKNQYRKQTPDHETNFGRNVVILVGSVLSFILILAIIREICLCCRFSRPTGPRTPFGDVYTDIAEIENRRTE